MPTRTRYLLQLNKIWYKGSNVQAVLKDVLGGVAVRFKRLPYRDRLIAMVKEVQAGGAYKVNKFLVLREPRRARGSLYQRTCVEQGIGRRIARLDKKREMLWKLVEARRAARANKPAQPKQVAQDIFWGPVNEWNIRWDWAPPKPAPPKFDPEMEEPF